MFIVPGSSGSLGGEIGRAVWADGGNEAQLLFVDHASHIVCQDTHRASFIAVSASAVRLEISRLEDFIALEKLDPRLLPARPYLPRRPQPRSIVQRAAPDAAYPFPRHPANRGAALGTN